MKVIKAGWNKWWHGVRATCDRCECEVELDRSDTIELRGEEPLVWFEFHCPECNEMVKIERPARTEEEGERVLAAKLEVGYRERWKYPVLSKDEADKQRRNGGAI